MPLSKLEWMSVVNTLSLTVQQERIVALLMQSKRDKDIAQALKLAVPTVRSHLERIYQRAGVEDRVELIHRVYALALAAWAGGDHQA